MSFLHGLLYCGCLTFSDPYLLVTVFRGLRGGIITMLPLFNRVSDLGRWYGMGKGFAFSLNTEKKKY